MKEYLRLKAYHSDVYLKLKKKKNLVSTIRLLLAVIFFMSLYFYFKTYDVIQIFILFFSLIIFGILIKLHEKISSKILLKKALLNINKNEITYLKHEGIPFENGNEYQDSTHAYSSDLNVFGENSLFQNLNRTGTYIGMQKLGELLLSSLSNKEIKLNQEAIKELSLKIEWRQDLLSLAIVAKDSKNLFNNLVKWSEEKPKNIPKYLIVISYISPILFALSILLFSLFKEPFFLNLIFATFFINLLVVVTQLKKIKREIIASEKIGNTIYQYSLIIKKIEQSTFESEKLNYLKSRLANNTTTASLKIHKLSSLFINMESLNNAMGAALLNGSLLFHVHTLYALIRWKKDHSLDIIQWLNVIGELETLSSLANFSYNNSHFTFPSLNNNFEISLEELGHPLIKEESRVCNNVDFTSNNFKIITGSNMSGKSTFLRTLGINMVLTGIGSAICALKANIHPLAVIVSMQLTDSLNSNESYFFAEVKRLKQIMDKLDENSCFVILDEILRGTNSDDKRNGTIAVIQKLIYKNAIGAIATHDLEICQMAKEYPNTLVNLCFEVEIINNDLFFDYKLRTGVCKNRSATFLMRKWDVI